MDDSSTSYPTDVSDCQWNIIERIIPASKAIGADRVTSMRAVVNAILYRRRSGCAWRMLPHDFPHWRTIYGYARRWHDDGTWEHIEAALREVVPCTLCLSADSNTGPRSQDDVFASGAERA